MVYPQTKFNRPRGVNVLLVSPLCLGTVVGLSTDGWHLSLTFYNKWLGGFRINYRYPSMTRYGLETGYYILRPNPNLKEGSLIEVAERCIHFESALQEEFS